mgnify:CR=1 FL=1
MQVIQYKWFSFQCVLALLFIVVFDIKFEAYVSCLALTIVIECVCVLCMHMCIYCADSA